MKGNIQVSMRIFIAIVNEDIHRRRSKELGKLVLEVLYSKIG